MTAVLDRININSYTDAVKVKQCKKAHFAVCKKCGSIVEAQKNGPLSSMVSRHLNANRMCTSVQYYAYVLP